MKNTKYLGFFFIIISAIIYGCNGFLARQLEVTFGSFSQQYTQCIISGTVALVLILVLKIKMRAVSKRDIIPFATFLLASGFISVLLYTPFQRLQLGTVLFLYYSSMLITGVIGGAIFFKEKFTVVKIISFLFAIVGIILIYFSNIQISVDLVKYIILALLAGISIGVFSLSSKKLSTDYSPTYIYFLSCVAAIVVAAIGALVIKEPLPVISISPAWGWIAIYSLAGVIANISMFNGFKYLEAQTATIVSISEILVAVLAGLIIYSEIPTVMTLIGGILIVLANIIIIIKQKN